MSGNRDSLAALTVAERVSAGIDFLDREVPGWDAEIDLDNLWLDSCSHCVLGQLFGEFRKGREALDIEFPDTARLGFDRDDTDPCGTYDELTSAWLTAIQARREVTS